VKLTVYFEVDFWVGVIEDVKDGKLRAARYIFGAEPMDAEVLEFVRDGMMACIERASQGVPVEKKLRSRINPKRLAREAAAELKRTGVSAQAQEALKLELEHRKKVRKVLSREQREAEKERKREIARQKAKAKHRGR
jgi:hypothetical protein